MMAQNAVQGQNVVFGNQNVNGGVHYHQSEPSEDQRRDERQNEFLQALYTCPYSDRKNRNERRVPGTCEWFTNHTYFRRWRESETSSLLWVSADPGCGKSVLTRYLVDDVLKSTNDNITCYFFFKDDFDDQKSSANAICAILRQIFLANRQLLSDPILNKFKTDGPKFFQSFDEQWRLLLDIAMNKYDGEIVCLLDALDECQDGDRVQFIRAVEDFYRRNSGRFRLKFLLTSRPYEHIWCEFRVLEKQAPTIHLSGEDEAEIEKISQEIDLVIAHRVETLCNKKDLMQEEYDFLLEKLKIAHNRTYLWVTLTLDVIQGVPGFTRGNVQKVIDKIPGTVEAAYNAILNKSTDASKAKLLLHIVTAATMPLFIEEVSWAMAIGGTQRFYKDIMDDIEPKDRFRSTVRQLCGLFVTVIDNKVYLLHQSAKEFLVQSDALICPTPHHPPAQGWPINWKLSLRPNESNRILANVCLCASFSGIIEGCPANTYFYSPACWSTHFRKADVQKEDPIVELAIRVCDKIWKRGLPRLDLEKKGCPASFQPTSALSVASYLGLKVVVERLLELGENPNYHGRTLYSYNPLSYAAAKGDEELVELLLKQPRVVPDSRDNGYRRTPLSLAAAHGHNQVVESLIRTEKVNLDSKDWCGDSPLSLAAKNGHKEVVKLLLRTKRVTPDSKDVENRTPLSYAAWEGYEEVVKLLLDTDKVDPDSKDVENRTPLSYAAWEGYEEVVKLLLDTDKVDPDSKDVKDRTPLSYAARHGHRDVVKLLLDATQAHPDSRDVKGCTPLSYAVIYGHEKVVKLLLDTKKVNPDSKNRYGHSPFSNAIQYQRVGIIKLFLMTRANSKNKTGKKLLPYIVKKGNGRAAARVYFSFKQGKRKLTFRIM